MKIRKTERGFKITEFTDLYGQECSLQESSLATDDAIWFGIDKTSLGLTADQPGGPMVSRRMHLNKNHVKQLIPVLQYFVKTGYLPKNMKEAQ